MPSAECQATSTRPAPEIWARNLTALRGAHPHLAEILAATTIPDDVQPVFGRDGSPTYRLPQPGGGNGWLGHSSMPTISGPALARALEPHGGNILLPSLGHGAEAAFLLQHRPPHCAVLAWDTDPLIPALALRLHDFSRDLRLGRLALAVGPQVDAALAACFQDHPCHLPPATILSPPQLDAEQRRALQVAVERAAAEQDRALLDGVRAAETRIRATDRRPSSSLVILSMVPHARIAAVAAGLAHAAREADLECRVHVADRPGTVHLRAALQTLADAGPARVLLLDQCPGEYGDLLDEFDVVTWCTVPDLRRPEVLGAERRPTTFCVDAGLARELEEADVLGPAADPDTFRPTRISPADRRRLGADVAVVLDAASTSAEVLGLKWDSHRLLFARIVEHLRRRPRSVDESEAEDLLNKACRETGVIIDASETRRDLRRIIAHQLAPTMTVLELLPRLASRGVELRLWGQNWELYDDAPPRVAAPGRPTAAERNLIYSACRVVLHLGSDAQAGQHLLEALAAGATVIRQAAAGEDGRPAKPLPHDVLKHVPAFHDLEQAVALLESTLADGSDPCQTAREAVLQRHLFRQRLDTLLSALPARGCQTPHV